MKYNSLRKNGYNLVKVSKFRGYVSTKVTDDNAVCIPYKGRYGKGYKVERNNSQSTQYALVEYWVK